MSQSYVYLWSSPEDGLLYIGKGKNNRAGSHLRDKPWARGINLNCRVEACGNEAEALRLESYLIQVFRGGSLKNGCCPRAFSPSRDFDWAREEPARLLESLLLAHRLPPRFDSVSRVLTAVDIVEEFAPRSIGIESTVRSFLEEFSRQADSETSHLAALIAIAAASDRIVDEVAIGVEDWREDS